MDATTSLIDNYRNASEDATEAYIEYKKLYADILEGIIDDNGGKKPSESVVEGIMFQNKKFLQVYKKYRKSVTEQECAKFWCWTIRTNEA